MLGAVYLINHCSLTAYQSKDACTSPRNLLQAAFPGRPPPYFVDPIGQGTIDSSLQHKIAHMRLWAPALRIKQIQEDIKCPFMEVSILVNSSIQPVFWMIGGNQIELFKFGNSYQGFTGLEKKLIKVSSTLDDGLILGMEATGHYCFLLYQFLIDKEYQVKVFNPIKVNRFRDFYIQPVKTNPKDAFVIASILRYGKVKPTSLAPVEVQRLQRLVRYRRYLCDSLTQVKNKICCMLDEVFPEYQSVFSNLFGKGLKALLKIAPIPEKILALPAIEWAFYLERHSRTLGWERAYEKANLIYQAAKLFIGSKTVAQPLKECIKDLIFELEHLENRIHFFTEEIEDALSLTPGAILTTIPGVGVVTVAEIMSGIGNINEFKSADQLVCYCGLIPTSYSSGTFTSTRNRMAKRGQTSLAWVFYQVALTGLTCNPALREHYLKKLSQGKPKKVALVTCARKLVRIVYSMLKSNQAYNDAFKSKSC